ncbi:DNA replication licensing factor MCM6-like [Trifolium medium]|uniref:DNA helicase n=1 Tax=Trifolium medium TaxID=97028 RepID=A0A392MG13_9FABA|nr:DNA replication licensing factor MCM6-like [Trifolium medium]
MTVRQLEALIRLSEAIARCHLDNQVQTRHVRLAVKLLQTSIIRVESSEIDLSEFQDQDMDEEAGSGEGNDNNDADDGQVGSSTAQQAAGTNEKPADGSIPQRKKSTVTDEYFQRITKALVMRLRQHEETVMQQEHGETVMQKGDGLAGMRQRDLIKWYVDQQNEKNNYSSVEEAKVEISQIKAIIEILIRREGHLIVVDDGRQTATEAAGAEQSESAARNDRILAVAPNYVVE